MSDRASSRARDAARAGARRAAGLGRRALEARGIEVRRAGTGPRRTLAEVLAHLRGLGVVPATVVDVGVASGTPDLYAAFPEARLLLVEPMAEWRATLAPLVAERGGRLVIAAAGAAPGSRELAVHRVPACSSLVGERSGDGASVETRTVDVVTLDDVVAQAGLPGPYVLKVDVEGGELEVLRGAPSVLERCEVVLLEVSLFELNAGAPQFADVVAELHRLGWVPYDLYGGHVRPLDGALAQLDVAFVKAGGRLRADHRYATAEQADRLYRSWGL